MGTNAPIFWAVRPHDAGVFQANYVKVSGNTREEVLQQAYEGMIGGRYLSQILAEDGRTELWNEREGWTDKADGII